MISIMGDKQNQSAGDNSQQLQAHQMVVNLGIDEKRAREIYQEMNLQLRKDYTEEALEIAKSRVLELENKLMPKMEKVDGAMEAFADPSFQLLLVEAQKTAASSERPADYDLLAELLLHRFKKGENRVARAGINRAVKIVDEISDDALLGLTVSHCISSFLPMNGDINQGLDILDNLFGKILYADLPQGKEWLDHLEILDTVRINSFAGLKKIEQYYGEVLSGYTDCGIDINSENYQKAEEILGNNELPINILVNHQLNNNFKRLNIPSREQIDSLTLQRHVNLGGQILLIPQALTQQQKNALNSIFDLYKQDQSIKQENIQKLMLEWNKRKNLNALREWWDNLTTSFEITSVGKVLAHSNAQRCDSSLPALD